MFRRNFGFLRRFYAEVKNMAEFQKAAIGKELYVVQFSAAWCNPCKMVAAIMYKKQHQSEGAWHIIKVDVDEQGNAEICQKYHLKEVPTLLFFKKDKEVQKLVGNQDQETLDKAIANLLKK